MDHAHLLTSFEGRIGRGSYWLGWLEVAVIALFFGVVSLFIAHVSDASFSALESLPVRLLRLVVSLGVLFPLAAVFVKRLHDRDKSGYHAVVPISLLALSNVINFVGLAGLPRSAAVVVFAVLIGTLVVVAWFVVELGFLRGTPGPNRYGPQPRSGS